MNNKLNNVIKKYISMLSNKTNYNNKIFCLKTYVINEYNLIGLI